MRLDVDARRCFVAGEEIKVRKKEFALLRLLLENPGAYSPAKSSSTACGAATTWATPRPSTCTSSGCARLIEDKPKNPPHITTVRGVGYRFEVRTRRESACRPAEVRGEHVGQNHRAIWLTVGLHERGPDPRPRQRRAIHRVHQCGEPSLRAVTNVGSASLKVAEPTHRGDFKPAINAGTVHLEIERAGRRGPEVAAHRSRRGRSDRGSQDAFGAARARRRTHRRLCGRAVGEQFDLVKLVDSQETPRIAARRLPLRGESTR